MESGNELAVIVLNLLKTVVAGLYIQMLPCPLVSENQTLPCLSIAKDAGSTPVAFAGTSRMVPFCPKSSPILPALNSVNQNVWLGPEIIASGPELLVGI